MQSVDITVTFDAIRDYVHMMALALIPVGGIAFGFAFGGYLMRWVHKILRVLLSSDHQLPPQPSPAPYLKTAVSDDDDLDEPLETTVPITRTHCIYCNRKLENLQCPGCGAPND